MLTSSSFEQMASRRRKRVLAAGVLAVLVLVASFPLRAAQGDWQPGTFHARIPLGVEGFLLQPSRRTLYLMTTAQSDYFEGWRTVGEEARGRAVVAPDGSRVQFFPAQVQFRVTATTMLEPLLAVDRDPLKVDEKDNVNDLLLHLQFRLKVFHGLRVTDLQPEAVETVGVPADVPYDERVFQATFALPQVPIEDRLVLEVLGPGGDRICKFHLEF